MKIAICLSGFPRTMNYTYPYFKKYVIDKLDPDIFYFGYEDEDHSIRTDDILKLYKPVSHVIRKFEDSVSDEVMKEYGTHDVKNINLAKGSPLAILSQYYNLFKSNELKKLYEEKHGFKYDVVYRMRTDYYFFEKPNSEVEKQSVYIPHLWNFGGVSDSFAYGDSESMDSYSSLFYNMATYNLKHGRIFHPESLFKYHLNQKKLTIVPIENNFWWELQDFKVNGHESKWIDDLNTNPSRGIFS
jgi:hypothetical protein